MLLNSVSDRYLVILPVLDAYFCYVHLFSMHMQLPVLHTKQ